MKNNRLIALLSFLILLGSLYGGFRMGTVKSLPIQREQEENLDLLKNDEAYQAYLPILQSEKEEILAYNWGKELPLVAFTDVNGDDVKDLLYWKAVKEEDGEENALLSIYSYYDGRLHNIMESRGWDKKEAEDSYCLFKMKGSNSLYCYFQDEQEENYGLLTEDWNIPGQASDIDADWLRKNGQFTEIVFSTLQEKKSPLLQFEKKHPKTGMGYREALEFLWKRDSSWAEEEEKNEEKDKEESRPEWSKAFYQYLVMEGQQLNVLSDTRDPLMALWDMDGDKIPELIIGTNETYGTYSSAKVIKYGQDGLRVLEGNMDNYGTVFGTNHTADPNYPGVYFHYWNRGDYVDANGEQNMDGEMRYYIIYSYIDGNEIKDIEVASYVETEWDYYGDSDNIIEYQKLCDDQGLFDATTVTPSMGIQFATIKEIVEMGWDHFVALNAIDKSDYYGEYSEVFHKAKIFTKTKDVEELDTQKLLTEEDLKRHLGSFVMQASYPINFYWNTKSFFEEEHTEYNAEYAKMAAVFCDAANSGKKEIEDCYKCLRFGKITTYEGSYESHPYSRASFAAAKYDHWKREDSRVKERLLFMISLGTKGTKYHFPYDYQKMRKEIQEDCSSIYQEFSAFYDDYTGTESSYTVEKDKEYALFITGEGQNAAVAEMLGKKFLENSWDQNSVIVYGLNTPNHSLEQSTEESLPLFNIINKGDLSVQYPVSYHRYGRTFSFAGEGEGISENHSLMRMMKNLSEGKPREETKQGDSEKTFRLIPVLGNPDIELLDATGVPMASLSGENTQYRRNSPFFFFKDKGKIHILAPIDLAFSLYIKGKRDETIFFQEQKIEEGTLLAQSSFDNIALDNKTVLFTELNPDSKKQSQLYLLRKKRKHSLEALFYTKEGELAIAQLHPHGEVGLFFHFSPVVIIFILFTLASLLLLILSLSNIQKGKNTGQKENIGDFQN